jgi:hypothetical protein
VLSSLLPRERKNVPKDNDNFILMFLYRFLILKTDSFEPPVHVQSICLQEHPMNINTVWFYLYIRKKLAGLSWLMQNILKL